MKTKSILLIIFAFIVLGCKNDKTETSTKEAPAAVTPNGFKVTLNVIVKKDDNFSLFYTEDGTIDFKGDPIWTNVKGSDTEQQVVYTLPEDVFPTELRLDLGLAKDQEDIILKSVILDYHGKTRMIAQNELSVFFRADESKCTFDPTTGTIKALVKNGVKQFPSLYPQEAILKPEMEKLAK